MTAKPSLVVFLHSDRYDRLYQASSLLLAASSMGWTCHLFLFYQALASFVEGAWDDVNIMSGESEQVSGAAALSAWAPRLQRGFEAANLPSLYDMLEKAQTESGHLHVAACTTSCKILDLDLAVVRERVDDIVGLHTMMQIAESARHVLYV